jgi:glycosyltransferase involved in cell wall biosynthesis
MGYMRRLGSFFEFSWKAAPRAVRLEGDVVFATSTPLTIALPGIYAARRCDIPMVFEVRDLWPEIPVAMGALRGRPLIFLAKWLERFAYRNSVRIVALSPGMKAGIVKTGFSAERVHVIPNTADLTLFSVQEEAGKKFRQQYAWLMDRPLVVYAGTIGKVNGVDYLVHVAAHSLVIAPEVRFLVVGEGAMKEKVRERAQELGILGKNFFMIDSIPKLEMPKLLSAATVATSLFIDLPEMWNNSANKFFDALASGTPVAINYQGWQASLLEESGAGLVLDARDTELAAQELVAKLRDPIWSKESGQASRALAEQRFSTDLLASELEDVLIKAVRH